MMAAEELGAALDAYRAAFDETVTLIGLDEERLAAVPQILWNAIECGQPLTDNEFNAALGLDPDDPEAVI